MKPNFQFLCEFTEKIHEGPGVVVRHLACSTLGKPKKLNFKFLCELTEKFMKDPVWWWWCNGGGGVTVFL